MRTMRAILTAGALAATAPALAATVSAQKPDTLAEALRSAGYEVVAGVDDTGDPVLDLVMQGYKARVLFFDCDDATHDKCGSVQFLSSFDAEGAGLTASDAVRFAGRHRYGAVTLNASGDPTLRWDVETGDGIPREVFLTAAARFVGTVQALGAVVFPKVAGQ